MLTEKVNRRITILCAFETSGLERLLSYSYDCSKRTSHREGYALIENQYDIVAMDTVISSVTEGGQPIACMGKTSATGRLIARMHQDHKIPTHHAQRAVRKLIDNGALLVSEGGVITINSSKLHQLADNLRGKAAHPAYRSNPLRDKMHDLANRLASLQNSRPVKSLA